MEQMLEGNDEFSLTVSDGRFCSDFWMEKFNGLLGKSKTYGNG